MTGSDLKSSPCRATTAVKRFGHLPVTYFGCIMSGFDFALDGKYDGDDDKVVFGELQGMPPRKVLLFIAPNLACSPGSTEYLSD